MGLQYYGKFQLSDQVAIDQDYLSRREALYLETFLQLPWGHEHILFVNDEQSMAEARRVLLRYDICIEFYAACPTEA